MPAEVLNLQQTERPARKVPRWSAERRGVPIARDAAGASQTSARAARTARTGASQAPSPSRRSAPLAFGSEGKKKEIADDAADKAEGRSGGVLSVSRFARGRRG